MKNFHLIFFGIAFALISAFSGGCKSAVIIPSHPLIVSQPPANPPAMPLSVAIVRVPRPISSSSGIEERLAEMIADAMDNGMLEGCRLVARECRLFADEAQAVGQDLALVPTNPYIEIGRAEYNMEITISADVKVLHKGDDRERGFLIQGKGVPGPPRPKREVTIQDAKFGLIGAKIQGGPFERAINRALFDFSIEFAYRTGKKASNYLIIKQADTPINQ